MRKLTSIPQFCVTSTLFSDDRLIEAHTVLLQTVIYFIVMQKKNALRKEI